MMHCLKRFKIWNVNASTEKLAKLHATSACTMSCDGVRDTEANAEEEIQRRSSTVPKPDDFT